MQPSAAAPHWALLCCRRWSAITLWVLLHHSALLQFSLHFWHLCTEPRVMQFLQRYLGGWSWSDVQ